MQAFIDLVQRHEQAFYSFVHNVHSKGEGLFKDLMHWIEAFLTVIRESLGEPISLEFLLPHSGVERDQIMCEIDRVALYHYKLKVLYEEKLRRRFVRAQSNSYHSDAEDEAAQELLDNIVAVELNFGDLVSGAAIDLAAQVTDEESSSEEYTSSEEDTDSEADSSSSQDGKMLTPKKSPMSPPVQPPHKQHLQNNRIPVEQRGATIDSSKEPVRRHRSLSLKSVRSFISFNNNARRSQDRPPPPVPPMPLLPAMVRSADVAHFKPPLQKQHPLSPMSEPEPDTQPPVPIKASTQQQIWVQPQQNGKQRSVGRETLKSPELHFIPQLLPVFVEMVSR